MPRVAKTSRKAPKRARTPPPPASPADSYASSGAEDSPVLDSVSCESPVGVESPVPMESQAAESGAGGSPKSEQTVEEVLASTSEDEVAKETKAIADGALMVLDAVKSLASVILHDLAEKMRAQDSVDGKITQGLASMKITEDAFVVVILKAAIAAHKKRATFDMDKDAAKAHLFDASVSSSISSKVATHYVADLSAAKREKKKREKKADEEKKLAQLKESNPEEYARRMEKKGRKKGGKKDDKPRLTAIEKAAAMNIARSKGVVVKPKKTRKVNEEAE